MKIRKLHINNLIGLFFITVISLSCQNSPIPGARWTEERISTWYDSLPWLVGCNYIPSTAINQLEMWQKDSYDPVTINRELGWAEEIGFNEIRVYLHDLLWNQDSAGFLKRMDNFLTISETHGIRVVFVLLDGVWNPYPKTEKQPDPVPFRHNSGWVQSPGAVILLDTTLFPQVERYIKGVVRHFAQDQRILAWDVFNEPDNENQSAYDNIELPNKAELAYRLMTKAYQWVREINPVQPLTLAVWRGDWSDSSKLSKSDRFMLNQSDLISFHNYSDLEDFSKRVEWLKKYNRPLLCSEYMARPTASTFQNILPYAKNHRIGAINWGFVSGKSQTIYPWNSWDSIYVSEPDPWFHDIYRPDGMPYDKKETDVIRFLSERNFLKTQQVYKNPLLDRNYPDPAILAGQDGYYYLYATNYISEKEVLNIQVSRSSDLIHWELLGDALPLKPVWANKTQSFWAPQVKYDDKNKMYLMYFSAELNGTKNKCLAVATSSNPEGPFTDKGEPLLCGEGFVNIDPMAFDDSASGKHYLYWGSGFKPIKVRELDESLMNFKDGTEVVDLVFPGKDSDYNILVEGAWVIKNDKWYYLFYSGDNCCGDKANYAVMVARADQPEGPFQRFGETRASGSSAILVKNDRWNAPGHNSVFRDKVGTDWLFYHAIDPADPGSGEHGKRVLLMDKVVYSDGWPVVEGNTPSTSEKAGPVI